MGLRSADFQALRISSKLMDAYNCLNSLTLNNFGGKETIKLFMPNPRDVYCIVRC